jgi:hypothetical protein
MNSLRAAVSLTITYDHYFGRPGIAQLRECCASEHGEALAGDGNS